MRTCFKSKVALLFVAFAIFLSSCNEDSKEKKESKVNGNTPESNVIVSFESKTQFQGLDEVRDSSGIVIEDSLTYISMENNQEIILKVSLAQSTEQFSSLELRTSNPSVFNLGLQSPANAASVPLQPGKSTSVYIRSFYNGTDEPRMQTDTMHVIGHGKEGETLLRSFRIGSYKRIDLNFHLIKAKANTSTSFDAFKNLNEQTFRDSVNSALNSAIVNVVTMDVSELIVPFDTNENGRYEVYPGETSNGPEYWATFVAFYDLLKRNVEKAQHGSNEEVVTVYVPGLSILRKTAQKVDEKTLKVRTPDYMPFTPNEVYYLASEQEIFNDGGPREKLTVERFYENDSIVVFKENIRATDVSGFVLMNANLITLGGATRGDYETQTARSLPIILNANELSTRESFYVPAHEVSHMFGLPDVVSEADNNLMTCMTNYWKPTGIPSLKGRPIAQSYTAKEGCPYDEKTNKSISQWDAWIREPKWTF